MKTRHLKFEYGPTEGMRGEYRWRIKAGNGEIIAHGEGYKRKRDAKRVYDLLRVAFQMEEVDLVVLDAFGVPIPRPRYIGTIVSSCRSRK